MQNLKGNWSTNNKKGKIVNLFKTQTKFMVHDPSVKAITYCGGFGSGKSYILTLKMIQIKLMYPQCDLLYITPVFSNFRDILIPTITEILDNTNIGYKINKTTGEIVFDVGGRIIVKSGDNPDSIIGFNVFAVFFDELDTMSKLKARALWNKAIARARKAVQMIDEYGELLWLPDGRPKNHINPLYVATTPESFGFIYEMFKKNKPKNYVLLQTSTRENTSLPEDYVENLEAIYPEALVQAYINGEFVNLTSGTVFSDFNRTTCNSSEVYRRGEPLHVGVDFNVLGINAVFYVKRPSLKDQGKEVQNYNYNSKETLVCIDHFQKVQDTPQLIDLLRSKYPLSNIILYPDASGANTSTKGATLSDISMLKQAGFRCLHPKKNPNIMDRVLAANSAFRNGLVRVNVDRSPDFTEALEQQVYNEKTEMPEKNVGANTIDDATDAGTYILHYLFPIKRKTFRSIDTQEV